MITKKNDIALIEFIGSIEFNDFIRPACIRTDPSDISESSFLVIAGWGSIEPDSECDFIYFIEICQFFLDSFFLFLVILFNFYHCRLLLIGTNRSDALLKANVNAVPLEQCNRTLVSTNLGNLPSLRGLSQSQMCAVNLAIGSDACQVSIK